MYTDLEDYPHGGGTGRGLGPLTHRIGNTDATAISETEDHFLNRQGGAHAAGGTAGPPWSVLPVRNFERTDGDLRSLLEGESPSRPLPHEDWLGRGLQGSDLQLCLIGPAQGSR